jgi:hypothetical protein
VPFEAIGLADAPAHLVRLWSGDIAAFVNDTVYSPSVRAVDRFGNSVSGAVVAFVVTAGGGSIGRHSEVSTDQWGDAIADSWILGPTPGANSVTASVPSGDAIAFSAMALDPERANWYDLERVNDEAPSVWFVDRASIALTDDGFVVESANGPPESEIFGTYRRSGRYRLSDSTVVLSYFNGSSEIARRRGDFLQIDRAPWRPEVPCCVVWQYKKRSTRAP